MGDWIESIAKMDPVTRRQLTIRSIKEVFPEARLSLKNLLKLDRETGGRLFKEAALRSVERDLPSPPKQPETPFMRNWMESIAKMDPEEKRQLTIESIKKLFPEAKLTSKNLSKLAKLDPETGERLFQEALRALKEDTKADLDDNLFEGALPSPPKLPRQRLMGKWSERIAKMRAQLSGKAALRSVERDLPSPPKQPETPFMSDWIESIAKMDPVTRRQLTIRSIKEVFPEAKLTLKNLLKLDPQTRGQLFKEAVLLSLERTDLSYLDDWPFEEFIPLDFGLSKKDPPSPPKRTCARFIPKLVIGSLSLDPLTAAGHESFLFFWGNTEAREARTAFKSELAYNFDFSSSAFLAFVDTVSKNHLKKEFDISDTPALDELMDEVYAYLAGGLHSGADEAWLRAMLRDYDAVKAAWDVLVEDGRTRQKRPSTDRPGAAGRG